MKIQQLAREHQIIVSSASLLGWDQETYMPQAAASFRAEQLSWLSARAHELCTSAAWQDALEEASQMTDPSDINTIACLHEMKRRYHLATKLPVELVAAETGASSIAKHAWVQARKDNDYQHFVPYLQGLVDIAHQKADLWGYANEPYDALLDCHERGATTASISLLFDGLRPQLASLALAAVLRSKSRSTPLPAGPYPIESQKIFNESIAQDIGFDYQAGRIDTTAHPFCTSVGPRDIRLTTRYEEHDFTSSLFGVLHEAGHGMYEQGLLEAQPGMPSDDAVSLGIHESQSRLWENHVGHSLPFWEKWYPKACDLFPQLRNFSLADFMSFVQRAEFSPIRVEADEATYDLHILLRFDLERLIFRNQLSLTELPEAWNEAYRELFGEAPVDNTHGCLQDIHWATGAFGYFPTYTLGNLNAAQLYRAAAKDENINRSLKMAEYRPLLKWLRENIHRHGALLDPAELIARATGEAPNAKHYLAHLQDRYLAAETY